MLSIFNLQKFFDQDPKFRHFTIGRNSQGEYQAAYARTDSAGYSTGISEDLGEAIDKALTEYDSQVGAYVKKGGYSAPKRVRDDDDLI